jgi:hypothetical protein
MLIANVDGAKNDRVFGIQRSPAGPGEADYRDANAGAAQSRNDCSVGDLVTRAEPAVGHDRSGKQQMHLTYPEMSNSQTQ